MDQKLNLKSYHCNYFEGCDADAAVVVDDDEDDGAVDAAFGFVVADDDAEAVDVD